MAGVLGAPVADPNGGALASLTDPTWQQKLALLGARLQDASDGGNRAESVIEQPFKLAQLRQQLVLGQLNTQALRGAVGAINGDDGSGSRPTNAGAPPQSQGLLTPQPQQVQQPAPDPTDDINAYANAPSDQQAGGANFGQPIPQAPGVAAAQTPPTAPIPSPLPPNPTGQQLTAWAQQRRTLATMALLAGHPDQAATILQPDLDVDRAGNVVDKHTGQLINRVPHPQYVNGRLVDLNDPNAPQSLPTLDKGQILNADGSVSNAPGYVDSSAAATAAQAAATAVANEAAKARYAPQVAGATASAEAAAKAPYEPVTFTGPNGAPITMSKQAFAAYQARMGGISGQTPADAKFDADQAGALSSSIGEATAAREPALVTHNNGMEIRNYALTHNMNNLGERALGVNKWLNTVPAPVLRAAGIDPSKISANANVGQIAEKLTSQSILQSAKNMLPSRYTERELNLMKPIAGNLTTPSEAMAYNGAAMAAMAERQVAQADFAAHYTGPKSQQAYEAAWQASPAGRASLFQSPAWQGVKIGGKPAVQTFTHNGKPYIAFGAGMGKPVFVPAVAP